MTTFRLYFGHYHVDGKIEKCIYKEKTYLEWMSVKKSKKNSKIADMVKNSFRLIFFPQVAIGTS